MINEERLMVDVPAQWRDQVAVALCECAIGLARQGESHPRLKLRATAIGLSEALQALDAGNGIQSFTLPAGTVCQRGGTPFELAADTAIRCHAENWPLVRDQFIGRVSNGLAPDGATVAADEARAERSLLATTARYPERT